MFFCVCCFCFVVNSFAHSYRSLRRTVAHAPHQQITDILRAADAAISSDVARGNSGAFLEAFSQQMDEDAQVLSSQNVSEAIAKANSMLPDALGRDPLCKRNWQGCPDGWRSTGTFCSAPRSYKGGCQHLVALDGAAIAAKRQFAEDCEAPWPCSDHCSDGHEYDEAACPQGWLADEYGFCVRSGLLDPHSMPACTSRYQFEDMSIKDKQYLTAVCLIEWPCSTEMCAPDYSVQCPTGWIAVGLHAGVCTAPANYAGDCAYEINVTGWRQDEKEAFAVQCGASYPCCLNTTSRDCLHGVAAAADDLDGPV